MTTPRPPAAGRGRAVARRLRAGVFFAGAMGVAKVSGPSPGPQRGRAGRTGSLIGGPPAARTLVFTRRKTRGLQRDDSPAEDRVRHEGEPPPARARDPASVGGAGDLPAARRAERRTPWRPALRAARRPAIRERRHP